MIETREVEWETRGREKDEGTHFVEMGAGEAASGRSLGGGVQGLAKLGEKAPNFLSIVGDSRNWLRFLFEEGREAAETRPIMSIYANVCGLGALESRADGFRLERDAGESGEGGPIVDSKVWLVRAAISPYTT